MSILYLYWERKVNFIDSASQTAYYTEITISPVGWVERNLEYRGDVPNTLTSSSFEFTIKNVVKPNFKPLAFQKPQKRWVSLGLCLMSRFLKKFRFLSFVRFLSKGIIKFFKQRQYGAK